MTRFVTGKCLQGSDGQWKQWAQSIALNSQNIALNDVQRHKYKHTPV